MFWNLFLPTLGLLAAVVFALSWQATRKMTAFHMEQSRIHLAQLSALAEPQAIALLKDASPAERQETARRIKNLTGCRVTLIADDGIVLADTDEDFEAMDNHGARPEILEARQTGEGTSVRFSHTVRQTMMYHARRITDSAGTTLGFLRVARPMQAIEQTMAELVRSVFVMSAWAFILAVVIAAFLAHQISGPLHRMAEAAEALAQGDFDRRVPYSSVEDVRRLADAFNRMVVRLQLAVRNSERQMIQSKAILESMAEGVVAIDCSERIVSVNSAARALLEISSETCAGKLLAEVVRHPDILEAARETLAQQTQIHKEAVLRGENGSEQRMEIRANPLFDDNRQPAGAVLVLHDITRLWKLEQVRRDFVANVSHELKTPITSIKGAVETLLDGAVEDTEARNRFLDIIRRHADRLNAIITDLLALSRLEQEGEARQIVRQPTPIRGILEEVAQICRQRAQEKSIPLEMTCPDDLTASVSPDLLEQAVINLVDNAIKFSSPGSPVRMEARMAENRLEIEVKDQGCGIPEEHLPRIFERFYRVDKARSRSMGGTGLGLAIVKHIVQLHGGSVTVESKQGIGSCFCIAIPKT